MLNKLEAAVIQPSSQKGAPPKQLPVLDESTSQFPLSLHQDAQREPYLNLTSLKSGGVQEGHCPWHPLPDAPAGLQWGRKP